MRLSRVEIEGYRSIKEKISLFCDSRITVLLGPNDHGKTNLLEALLHLNPEHSFDQEHDLNWDNDTRASELPHLTFEFAFDSSDHNELESAIKFRKRNKTIAEIVEREKESLDDLEIELEEKTEALNQAEVEVEQTTSAYKSAIENAKNDPENSEFASEVSVTTRTYNVAQENKINLEKEIKTATKLVEKQRAIRLGTAAFEFQNTFETVEKKKSDEDWLTWTLVVTRNQRRIAKSALDQAQTELEEAVQRLEEIQNSEDTDAINNTRTEVNSAEETVKKFHAELNSKIIRDQLAKSVAKFVESEDYKKLRHPSTPKI